MLIDRIAMNPLQKPALTPLCRWRFPGCHNSCLTHRSELALKSEAFHLKSQQSLIHIRLRQCQLPGKTLCSNRPQAFQASTDNLTQRISVSPSF